MDTRDIVDTRTLADDYAVAPITIRRWAQDARIPAIRPTPRTLRFSRRAVAERLGLSTTNGKEFT